MTRRFAPVIFGLSLLSTLVFARDITIHGFVTAVNSPTSFEIDDYKITAEKPVLLEFDERQDERSTAKFTPKDIRIGTELEIAGEYNESSRELKAKSIRVFVYDTLIVKRTALLETLPKLANNDSGWTGVINVDGERITVSPATTVTQKPNRAERKSGLLNDASDVLKFSPDFLNLDTFVRYEGIRQSDGSIMAQSLEFEHAEIENGEARMRRRFVPAVINPDYASGQPGELEKQIRIVGMNLPRPSQIRGGLVEIMSFQVEPSQEGIGSVVKWIRAQLLFKHLGGEVLIPAQSIRIGKRGFELWQVRIEFMSPLQMLERFTGITGSQVV